MEFHWLKHNGHERLVIFVLGWAADNNVVSHIDIPDADILTIYDYRDVPTLPENIRQIIDEYPEKYLFAWSFGVWAAEQLLSGINFDVAAALNGTPFPVHEQYGIEPRRLDITIRGLARGGMEQFERRAYGRWYDELTPGLSPRGIEANIAELQNLRDLSTSDYSPSINWSKAIVGSEDLIFTPHNMQNYWGNRAVLLPLPHYPFGDAGIITNEIGSR